MGRSVFSFIRVWVVFLFCFIGLAQAEDDSISSLLSVLQALYGDDPSQIPDDPNEIIALETSPEARDQLAWAVFTMLRSEIDPNYVPDKYPAIIEDVPQSPDPNEPYDPNANESWVVASSASMPAEPNGFLSSPLGSCIIPAGTYLIQTLPLEIEGHVVLSAGVKLIAPYDPNHAVIEVLPGGLLDVGRASFYSDQNYPAVLPPVEILSQDPNIPFNHNYAGIYVHRGANPSTRIQNITITGCAVGLVLDEQLNNPLHNVVTYGCYDGCHLYAPNTVINSEFWYNGSVWEEIFGYVSAGIYVCMDGVQYPYPQAAISQTVTYNVDVGIYIEGMTEDPNLACPDQVVPSVQIVNSCMAVSLYYGVYQSSGKGKVTVEYCGFGENWSESNLDLPYTGCVGLYSNPFYVSGMDKRLYIKPNSYLVDMGYGMAEDGLGTNPDRPDTGIIDIGCHFPVAVSGNFGIASSPADFNSDGIVDEADLALLNACMGATNDPNLLRLDFNYDSRINLPDFAVLSYDFGYNNDANLPGSHDPNSERSDLTGDHRVDLDDIAVMAELWLVPVFDEYRICSLCNIGQNTDPNDPDTSGVIDVKDYEALMADWGKIDYTSPKMNLYDPNMDIIHSSHLNGEVLLQIDQIPDKAKSCFILIDNIIVDKYEAYFNSEGTTLLNTSKFTNGIHQLKWGYYTAQGGIWLSEPNFIDISNKVSYMNMDEIYDPNQVYNFSGIYDGNGTLSISFGDPNCGFIIHPGSFNLTYFENTESFCPNSISISAAETIGSEQTVVFSSKKEKLYDPNDYKAGDYLAVLWLPNDDITSKMSPIIKNIEQWWNDRGIQYKKFMGYDCNMKTLESAVNKVGIKYFIAVSHMSCKVGDVARTSFSCWNKLPNNKWEKGAIFSYLSKDFSKPNNIPVLPGSLEKDNYSIYSLRIPSNKLLWQIWMIGCSSLNTMDMPWAWGLRNETASRVYFGNRDDVAEKRADELLNKSYIIALSQLFPPLATYSQHGGLGTMMLRTVGSMKKGERQALFGNEGTPDADMPDGGADDDIFRWFPVHTFTQLDTIPIDAYGGVK